MELRRLAADYGVLRPRIFGSVLTGADTEDSDLDLLVDPSPGTTLVTMAKLQADAERLLGIKVDVLTPKSLPIRFRERVLGDAMPLRRARRRESPTISAICCKPSAASDATRRAGQLGGIRKRHEVAGRRGTQH